MMIRAIAGALALTSVLATAPTFAATSCTGTVRDLRILGDGTVTVVFNVARPGVALRVCSVSRALPNPLQTAGGQGRVVTQEACGAWVAILQSAVARATALVDVQYLDTPAAISSCGLVPADSTPSPNPVYLPTGVVVLN